MRSTLIAPLFGLAAAGLGFAQATPSKIGIIHVQNAIISTRDGQKAAADLQTRFLPKKGELDKKQAEIQGLQEQLKRGSNTMSEDARTKLVRDIDEKGKRLGRDTEDAQAEFDQEQGKIMQEIGGRMMGVLDKFAKEGGFALILDVSAQTTPVLWAANGIDVTKDIIDLYDKAAPAAAAPPAGAPKPATPMAPKPAAPPPAARPPATKK